MIPMRPSPKSLTRRPINSAAEPHGRTAAGSLDQNDSVATRRVVDEGVRSCPAARVATYAIELGSDRPVKVIAIPWSPQAFRRKREVIQPFERIGQRGEADPG